MTGRYPEEFAAGQKFASGPLKVDRERIKSFAAEFGPRPSPQRRGRRRVSFQGLGRQRLAYCGDDQASARGGRPEARGWHRLGPTEVLIP